MFAVVVRHRVQIQAVPGRQAAYGRPFLTSLRKAVFRECERPKPQSIPETQSIHGRKRVDRFSWMENADDPNLAKYIQAENAWTRHTMRKQSFLQKVLMREMKKRLHIPKQLPPLKTVVNGYEYYSSTSNYGMVYLRKNLAEGRHAKEEVLLDAGFLRSMNMSIRKVLLSPDHTVFAYNTEREGMEHGDLHIKYLSTQKSNEILFDVFNFVWANNNTIYYTVPNPQLRPHKVYAHRLGTDQEDDILVFEEPNDSVFVDITSTKDHQYVTINCNSLSSSEVRVIPVNHDFEKGAPDMTLVQKREPGIEYYVDHHNDTFYILTNADGATNFKLMRTPSHALDKSHWENVITVGPTETIDDVDVFQDHVVVYGRRDGLPMVLCHDMQTQETHPVPLPETFCVLHPGTNLEFNTDTFRFSLVSPFAHESTYDYNVTKKKLLPVRVQPIHRFDRSQYACTRTHAKSHDGKDIPVTLIHPKNIQLNGRNPVLMRSYGAYGMNTDPEFRVENFPLLERGWIIALAHVRGGSELGRTWYKEGKLEHKMNSFRDFISVAEHLIHAKLTTPEFLAAMGGSAGGLLVGAMLHMRPDLFRALVCRVPFVDPLSAMLQPDHPLTQIEYPEWGNPTQDAAAYDLIRSYAPYDNTTGLQTATSTYVTAGLKDQRVAYWQPLKWVAAMRHDAPATEMLLKVDEDRGHFGGGSEQDVRLSELAEQLAFLISRVQK